MHGFHAAAGGCGRSASVGLLIALALTAIAVFAYRESQLLDTGYDSGSHTLEGGNVQIH